MHTYQQITDSTKRTIEKIAEASRGALSEDNQSWWDMARGAMRVWEDLVGDAARAVDRERLQLLIDGMPSPDDHGSGNWHLTSVVRL